VGALGHFLEREGIPTTGISLVREHTEKIRPPRALWVTFELGRLDTFPEMQHSFQMCAGRAPEANDAISRLADWVRPKLGLADASRPAGARHS
jgi:hypothetical protein